MPHGYPWYDFIEATDGLEQGDLIFKCPVFKIAPDTDTVVREELYIEWEIRDVIIMSQSCDLVHDKLEEVLLCPVWKRSTFDPSNPLSKARELEKARRGQYPAFHVLAKCEPPEQEGELRVVDFRRIFTLPMKYLKRHALSLGQRYRLLPPYREHLSQAFARYFMRVGLPVDIPPIC